MKKRVRLKDEAKGILFLVAIGTICTALIFIAR